MSEIFAPSRFVPLPVLAAAFLVAATLAGVGLMRLSGAPKVAEAPAAVLTERQLRFADMPDGGVNVIDVLHPERSEVLAAGSGLDGFLRATLRTLARERKRQGVGAEPPFKLSALADGRVVLEDPTTGRRVDLEAFGPTNAGRFARLLDTRGAHVAARPEPQKVHP